MKVCGHCLTENDDIFLFCKQCGQRLEEVAEPVMVPLMPDAEEPAAGVPAPVEPAPAYAEPPAPVYAEPAAEQPAYTGNYAAAPPPQPPAYGQNPYHPAGYGQTQPPYAQSNGYPAAGYNSPGPYPSAPGNQLAVSPGYAQPAYPPPVYGPGSQPGYGAYPQPYGYGAVPMADPAKTHEAARRLMTSPLVLIVAVLTGAQLLLSFLNLFMQEDFLAGLFLETTEAQVSRASYMIGGVIGLVPSILLLIGWLMTYMAGRNKQSPLSAGGLSMIRVVKIVLFVLMMLAFAFILLMLFIVLMVGTTVSEFSYDLDGLEAFLAVGFGFILFIMLIAAGLVVLYHVFVFRALGSAIKTVRTGQPVRSGLAAFGVLSIIIGSLVILAALLSLTALSEGDGVVTVLVSMLSLVFGAAFNFAVGILALKANRELEAIY